MEEEKKKPVKEFSFGYLKIAIWENKKDDKTFKSLSPVIKSYKNKEDEWANTSNLTAQDLPDAILCMQKAYEYLKRRE